MFDLTSVNLFVNNMATLKETSLDDHDQAGVSYMTASERTAVNFDKVKDEYFAPLGVNEVQKSNDALFDNGYRLVFVEFKAGKILKKKRHELRQKIYNSVLIFTDVTAMTLTDMRREMDYILVYNETANAAVDDDPELIEKRGTTVESSGAYDEIAKSVSALAKREYICFGLRPFEKYCFRKVHTYTQAEFEQYLSKL